MKHKDVFLKGRQKLEIMFVLLTVIHFISFDFALYTLKKLTFSGLKDFTWGGGGLCLFLK